METNDLDNTAPVEKHDVLWGDILNLFKPGVYNDCFNERHVGTVFSTPVDPYSSAYEFNRASNNVGLMKVSSAVMCKMQIRRAPDTPSPTNANVAIVPCPLTTMWKTIDVKINDTNIVVSGNLDHYANYIDKIFSMPKEGFVDDRDISLAHFDTTEQMNVAAAANLGFIARRNLLRGNNEAVVIDEVPGTLFKMRGEPVLVPTAFKLDIKLTRAENNVILTGTTVVADVGNAAGILGLTAALARVSIKDFHLKIPIFKTKEQITDAINTSFIRDKKEAKYYVSNFRVTPFPTAAGLRKVNVQNIFNGAVPTRLYIVFVAQANWNGTFTTNAFDFQWPNYSSVIVNVNGAKLGEISNQEEAYVLLREVLDKKYSKMPFSFAEFKNGYSILGFDLNVNKDSSLSVLPIRPSGNVDIDMIFSEDTIQGTIAFIGEFRNELKMGLDTTPRLLHSV